MPRPLRSGTNQLVASRTPHLSSGQLRRRVDGLCPPAEVHRWQFDAIDSSALGAGGGDSTQWLLLGLQSLLGSQGTLVYRKVRKPQDGERQVEEVQPALHAVGSQPQEELA